MNKLRIPVGPQHPLLKEPLSFEFGIVGEQIDEVRLRIGYVHRGLEHLCQQKTYHQVVHIVERICGICSHVHTTAYCQAVEALLGVEAPPRAAAIRVLLCELERVHSHLLWIGVLGEAMGFTTIFMYAWRAREIALDLMEMLTGGRVSHTSNIIGGVRTDLNDEQAAQLWHELGRLEHATDLFRDLLEHDHMFELRTKGVAPLDLDKVHTLGVVGPTARASGCRYDVRQAAPYALYGHLDMSVITETAGDAYARARVRMQEISQSIYLCRQVVQTLPPGELAIRVPRRVPEGSIVMRCEAPRGELLYYVRSDGSERPARIKIRTPTLPALRALCTLLPGIAVADMPVVIAGADLCIACADR